MPTSSAPQLVPDIHLVKGVYKPTCADLPAVEVFCQAVVLNGSAYVWIDGINHKNPLLLPVQSLSQFQRIGTLREYLQQERHVELGSEFDELMTLCMERQDSATMLIRACEIMHVEHLPASQAVITAFQWGTLLNELDQAERAAYQLVSSGAAPRSTASTAAAPVLH